MNEDDTYFCGEEEVLNELIDQRFGPEVSEALQQLQNGIEQKIREKLQEEHESQQTVIGQQVNKQKEGLDFAQCEELDFLEEENNRLLHHIAELTAKIKELERHYSDLVMKTSLFQP